VAAGPVEQLGGGEVGLVYDPVRVGDDIPVRGEVEKLLVSLPFGDDGLLGGGEFFVLGPQLRLGGAQFLQGDVEFFLGIFEARH